MASISEKGAGKALNRSIGGSFLGAFWEKYRRLCSLVAILATVALAGTGMACWELYKSTFEVERNRLTELVRSQAKLLEAVAEFDAVNSRNDHVGGAAGATIQQMVNAHREYKGFGATGTFHLIRQEGDGLKHLISKARDRNQAQPRTASSIKKPPGPAMKPARRALNGESGAMVVNVRGHPAVLAAYEPVKFLDVALVAHIDLVEIRAPFIRAALISGSAAVVLIALGALLFVRIEGGTIRQLKEHVSDLEAAEARLFAAQRIAHIGNWEWEIATEKFYCSEETHNIFGRDPESFECSYSAFLEAVHPDDREDTAATVKLALAERLPYSVEHRIVRPDGEIRMVHNQGETTLDEKGDLVRLSGTVQDITERKRAQETGARFGRILEASLNEIFIFDSETCHFLEVNEGARRNLGYDMDQLRGMTAWDIKPEISEDEFRAMVEPLRTGEKGVLKFETFHRRQNGTLYPVDVVLQFHADEDQPVFVAVTLDVTERKKAEKQSNRFGRILDLSVNEFYVFDAESLLIVHANETGLRSTGYTMDELHHMAPYELSGELTREKFQQALAPLHDGTKQTITFETVRKRKDGGGYPIEVQIQHFDNEDPPVFVATVLNIAERKAAEEEIVKMNRSLEQRITERTRELASANQDLQQTLDNLHQAQDQLVEAEKMASLGGLVAGIAHEVNTPIGIGVTAASHLEESVRDFREKYDRGDIKRSDLEQHLATAEQSSTIVLSNLTRASELVRSFKQVAVDQSSEDQRRFDLREYLDEIVTSLRPNLKKAKHEVAIDCEEGLVVETYPGAVSQVVTNLIMNAITHAYEDGESGKMEIRVADNGDGTITLAFGDDGKGIPEENLPQIFDPFFTTRRGSGGSGLGLNIVYNLITQKLGGTIACTSEMGEGTSFAITFPATSGSASNQAPGSAQIHATA